MNLNIKPYQVYLLDYSPEQEVALYYYKDRKEIDNYKKEQKIRKIFLDIEVFNEFENKFPEPKTALKPINAITLVTDNGTIYSFILKYKTHTCDAEEIKDYVVRSFKEDYNIDIEESQINIYVMDNEKDLLLEVWKIIHEYDPAVLAGFNSNYFDYPYIFNRLINLFGLDQVPNIVSKFNEFEIRGFDIRVPDFLLIDILQMYKPGEGFGFGKNLPSFNLDTIAEEELGFRKVEHEESLDDLYVNNPKKFLFYNIIDTYLIYLLDKKLNHFQLFNTQRRISYCPVSRAYYGRSIMGEQIQTFNIFVNENKIPRSFLVKEKFSFEDENEFRKYSLSLSYYGAYVKQPKKGLYSGLIVDCDATSLYPSIMKMFNLEYSNLQAYIYNTNVSKFIKYLQKIIDKKDKKLYNTLINQLSDKILHYVKNVREYNKYKDMHKYNLKFVQTFIDTLINSNLSFKQIISNVDYYLFKTKLIPLLDIVNLVLSSVEYNDIIYDYFFLEYDKFIDKYKNTDIVVYVKPTDSNSKLDIITIDDLIDKYLKKYIVTISGALFTTHKEKVGYIIQLITDMIKERKKIKGKMKELNPESEEYKLLNDIQLSIKIFINSLYGIYGLTTYRYNNVYIANTITLSGRLILKTAQYIADKEIEKFISEGGL